MKIERTRKRCFRRLHSARLSSALLPQYVNCTWRWRHFTTTTRILQFVVFLCNLGLSFSKPVRDLQKFKKEKNEMESNVVIVKMAHWTKQCVWSSVSNSSPACIFHVFYFNFILKLRGANLLHSFYLRFIFCILTIGRNRPSRTKKKKKSENRTVPLRPQDYPSAVAVVRKWSRD